MRSFLLATSALLLLCQAASAQTPSTVPSSTNSAAKTNSNGIRTDIRDMLQNGGYSDIHMMPSSFVIRAKDKNGSSVVMTLSPDSFSQVTDMGDASSNSNSTTTGSAPQDNGTNNFMPVPNNSELSSNVVGLDVYNNENKDIGKIKDIAMNTGGRVQSYILSVGGFLGMGEHYVAVNPSNITVAYNDSDKKWHASMNTTAEQLKSAPEFKYGGRWSASHT
jgi:sporulation protein YlmC with PRC-barrel domain